MERLQPILKQYWGYDTFRPLQREAMECVLTGRDSVVVLPTGGGKSLCYQAPALAMPGLAVVVSPLISLMKDQVDALRANGVSAAFLNSSLSSRERFQVEQDIRDGSLTLLYAAPERLVTDGFLDLLWQTQLAFIAVDEAHCISAWGHDFRPEYRELRKLREAFPEVAIHGYTATATPHVRDDIAEQLNLRETNVLVGSFDRPNLSYRVQRRTDPLKQIAEIIDRHKGESGIVYCIRRSDVDDTCGALRAQGKRVTPYHAGMSDEDRKRSQEAFLRDEVDTVVATVAFGMGIDKSDVRYVIHAGMPKSLEHYQQETGRAGRDGLEAECTLLFSGVDYRIWRNFLPDSDPEARRSGQQKLDDMMNFCSGVTCRHRALVNYFGQSYDKEKCDACDHCLEEADLVEDPGIITAKILSCVLRLKERFGADYTTSVLLGSNEARIFERGHHELTTYGILKEYSKKEIRDWLEQLVEQGFLEKTGEYNVLRVTDKGRLGLRGEEVPRLLQPAKRHVKETKIAQDSWGGVDRDLFETLRSLRRTLADEHKVPAYVIFGDAALRDMARKKPSNRDEFMRVSGVGKKKCADYATIFLKAIAHHVRANPGDTREVSEEEGEKLATSRKGGNGSRLGSRPIPKRFPKVARDEAEECEPPESKPARAALRSARDAAFALFAQGASLEDACRQTGRAAFTVSKYLEEYVEQEQRSSPEPWVEETVFEKVLDAVQTAGTERLRAIYDSLQGEVSYDHIRLCLACLKMRNEERGTKNGEEE